MPTYDFLCRNDECGEEYILFAKYEEKDSQKCEKCGSLLKQVWRKPPGTGDIRRLDSTKSDYKTSRDEQSDIGTAHADLLIRGPGMKKEDREALKREVISNQKFDKFKK